LNNSDNDPVGVGIGKSILDLIALKSINGLSIKDESFNDSDFEK